MPEHGDFDAEQAKWFCGYWMTEKDWNDIHDYRGEGKMPDDEDLANDAGEE